MGAFGAVFSRFRPAGRFCEFQIPIARQCGTERSAPIVHVTYPFHSRSSCSGLVQAFVLNFSRLLVKVSCFSCSENFNHYEIKGIQLLSKLYLFLDSCCLLMETF